MRDPVAGALWAIPIFLVVVALALWACGADPGGTVGP